VNNEGSRSQQLSSQRLGSASLIPDSFFSASASLILTGLSARAFASARTCASFSCVSGLAAEHAFTNSIAGSHFPVLIVR
jgi:hypothetical protein